MNILKNNFYFNYLILFLQISIVYILNKDINDNMI